ncbi:MAG: cytochrome-c oxidase, cbb3-type subunit III [Rhodanobacteraceae bacterium]|nr:cytochrome-c oxidase, cbb3-type subunit III [Rhodanobacteraceae bacterium]
MSGAWSIYVIALTVITVVGSLWLLAMTAKKPEKKEGETTGHTWDGDLEEFNNPLPRWWLWLFIGTAVFSAGYLVLYPGFGSVSGTLGWTSEGELRAEQQKYDEIARQTYAKFASLGVAELAGNAEAVNLGRNIFANNCATCHGTDARGAVGFPNLTDASWQWGGEPEQILQTILNGRVAAMPSWAAVLGAEGTPQVTAYVRSLAGLGHNATAAEAGKARYDTICVACHGPEGKGNPALGAPDLTDSAWLYGSSEAAISESLTKGRAGHMPAHGPLIGEDAVRMVAGYVYSLRSEAPVAQTEGN